MPKISKKNYSEFDFAAQDLIAPKNKDYQDGYTRTVMADLDSLMLDQPEPDVEQPAGSNVINVTLDDKPDTDRQLQIDAKHMNSTFKASLGLYQFLIKRNRTDEADKLAQSIKAAWIKFDASHGADAHKRHLDQSLVRSFVDAMRGHKAENPVPATVKISNFVGGDQVANFEKISNFVGANEPAKISKFVDSETAKFEKNDTSETANFEKQVNPENATGNVTSTMSKTQEIRVFQAACDHSQDVEKQAEKTGPSLLCNIIPLDKKHSTPVILPSKTPLADHKKIGAPSPFTLAQSTPSSNNKRSALAQRKIEALPDPFHKRWRDVSTDQKLSLALMETENHGGYSFRLTFNERVASKLLRSSDPATVFCRDHLRPALKDEFGKILPYAFRFEFSKEGTLHIHGSIIIPEMERTNIEERLRSALNKAGGKSGESSQSHVRLLTDPLLYFNYLAKTTNETYEKMPANKKDITIIGSEMRDIIKSSHDVYRK